MKKIKSIYTTNGIRIKHYYCGFIIGGYCQFIETTELCGCNRETLVNWYCGLFNKCLDDRANDNTAYRLPECIKKYGILKEGR